MHFNPGQTLLLTDEKSRQLGQVTLQRRDGNLLEGHFEPGRDFAAVEGLFRAFEEAVECQALHAVEEIDALIATAALGLQLRAPDDQQSLAVRDVQIWSDGAFTCRLFEDTLGLVNGQAGTRASTQPAHD